MTADWITTPSARRVLQHDADSRPAWLWSQDGQTLIWQNEAATLFLAKLKKHGLKLAPPAVPIKGQIARNIRLGSPGRSSLARIQFLAGDKPTSSTCATTPLSWQDEQIVLLIVGVDPIDADVLAAATAAKAAASAVENSDAVVILDGPDLAPDIDDSRGPPLVPETAEPVAEEAAWAGEDDDTGVEPEVADAPAALSAEARNDADEHAYARELESWRSTEAEGAPLLSLVPDAPADVAQPEADDAVAPADDDAVEPADGEEAEAEAGDEAVLPDAATLAAEASEPDADDMPETAVAPADAAQEAPAPRSRLSQLVDRMAADEALYTPLTEADDAAPIVTDSAAPQAGDAPTETPGPLFRVTGRGFTADAASAPGSAAQSDISEFTDAGADLAAETSSAEVSDAAEVTVAESDAAGPAEPAAPADGAGAAEETTAEPTTAENQGDTPAQRLSAALAEIAAPATTDPEIVERVSRYNFDELSRILNDRVGEAGNPPQRVSESNQRGASLVSLGGETLVLNRLPLGILVFRDQQLLFANRAITEMVGYDSVDALRQAGLSAIFPAVGTDEQAAGPVNHLVQRDGTLVPVTARLQSISWHGRPALMLSASATEVRTGHEGAVNAFAQALAEVRGDGFFEATQTGVISTITGRASSLLGQNGPVEGKALSSLVAGGEVAKLRAFLDRPARFAETSRPWLMLSSVTGRSEVTLFAQGQAGVVTGYFGLVRGRDAAPARVGGPTDADPALLARISRGVRRPLNTIIGFADLIGGQSSLSDPAQLQGYARDISAAGQDIAALVDELEDYARLRDGRYLPQRASIDLTEMLESCILRIRQQASNARVFVRNAISETLPRLTADRASLEQAVLNLLASAIDQSPNGGAVVISAQRDDDGSIAVHVRDSSVNVVDMAERFVVFRDGPGRDGKMLAPVRSSVGLALTRSLLAVNAFSLSVDPAGEKGMLFTLKIPADLVEKLSATDVAE